MKLIKGMVPQTLVNRLKSRVRTFRRRTLPERPGDDDNRPESLGGDSTPARATPLMTTIAAPRAEAGALSELLAGGASKRGSLLHGIGKGLREAPSPHPRKDGATKDGQYPAKVATCPCNQLAGN